MKNQNPKNFIGKFKYLILPSFLFLAPLFLYLNPLSKSSVKTDQMLKLFFTKEVQENNYSVVGKRISRQDATREKINLLEKMPTTKKDIVVISNHQAQYFFKGNKYINLFNLWIGNYGITELADLIGYIYEKNSLAFPNKILVVSITSPNNDMGGNIVGYQNDLPSEMVGFANLQQSSNDNKFIPLSLKHIMPGAVMRSLEYTLDYKKQISFYSSYELAKSSDVGGEFAVDINGSSTGFPGVGNRNLVFNEAMDFSSPKLSMKDVDEISDSILYIQQICQQAGVKLVILIPPVYESAEDYRMNSSVNLILDKALDRLKKTGLDFKIIDDRRNPKFLGVKSSNYYYHFDHPSPDYGEDLYNRLMDINS